MREADLLLPARTSGLSSLDLLNFFSPFDPGLYMLEFKIVCCDQFPEIQSNCGTGDFKTAWINLEEEFSYGILGAAGFFPVTTTFEPSEEANGTIYSDISGDFFNISLHSIQNGSGTDIEVSLTSTLCDDNPNNDTNFGMQTFGPNIPIISIPFASFNSADCMCFQLDVSYDDGCDTGITTDSWYFQSGPECTDGFNSPDDPIFRRASQVKPNQEVRLLQNPIQNQIRFDTGDLNIDLIYNLDIIDLQGRSVFSLQGTLDGSTLEIPFQKSAGTYFYSMQVGDTLHSGKIIKL